MPASSALPYHNADFLLRFPKADPSLFFHSRQQLKDRLAHEKDQIKSDASLADDLSIALQYIEEHHGCNIATVEQMTLQNEITWELLWALV